ncbi:MAG: potassium transporter TrkA [Actinobacteria bacterium]|nr:potassium transporter TrkA [Actinomycetota bacterium]
MAKKSFKEKLRYNFDNLMSKGTLSLIGFLAIIFIAFIVIFTIILWLINLIPDKSIIELFWLNIFKTLNTGTFDDAGVSQLNFLLSLLITLVSIFITSLLISLLTTGIQQKIWSLRKGRSKVQEVNHTIILGWSEIVFTIIRALMEASKNQKKCKIVIMGNKDKVEMEDAIRERIKLNRNMKIICRQGNPIDLNDLKIVNLPESKSIIIIEDTDSKVLKTILAINNSKETIREKPYNIVAMLNESKNLNSGKIAGAGQAKFILNINFIARLIAQTCYQPGLSLVYNELLNFKGDEIYIRSLKELTGKSFKEALFMFEDSAIIGISDGKNVKLNPPADTIIGENDSIVAISADDDTIILSGLKDYKINENVIHISEKNETKKEKILILGWNERAKIIINELKNYVAPDTEITVVVETNPIEEFGEFGKAISLENQDFISIEDIKVRFIQDDINDHNLLTKLAKEHFNHIVVLAYTNKDIQEADSITLMTLIHLRDIAEKNNLNFSLTSEMLDINNRALAKVAKVNDFIVSEKLTSLLLAQISENEQLDPVFEDLLNESGSEIYQKKIKDYIKIGEPVNFYTILEAAGRKNDLAIGFRIAAEENFEEKNFGIYINPDKSSLFEFTEDDSLILLSEKI